MSREAPGPRPGTRTHPDRIPDTGYRLRYVRGPEGIVVGLAEELG
ncbi:hypothetical protein ACFV0O_28340 [Kitasatospora sp. NPDC059577]